MPTLRTSILCVQLVCWKLSFCMNLCEREKLLYKEQTNFWNCITLCTEMMDLKNHSETLGGCQFLALQHEIQMKLCRQGSHTFHAGFCMHNLPSCCKALVHHMLHDSVSNPIVQLASGCCMEICTQILMFSHASFCCDITIRAVVWPIDWADGLLPLIQPRTSWELRVSGQFGHCEMKKLCSRESSSGGNSFEGRRTPRSQATTRYLASFSMVDTT
jgi:hypothetical protein